MYSYGVSSLLYVQDTDCGIDLDTCRSLAPCLNGATCINDDSVVNGYRCECATEYFGPNCDSHPCDDTNNMCLNGATCIVHVNATRNYSDWTCIIMFEIEDYSINTQ